MSATRPEPTGSLAGPATARPVDVAVAVPRSWLRRSDPARGLVLAARARHVPASGVRPEIVVRAASVGTDDLATWRAVALADLARQVEFLDVEDADDHELGGLPVAYRRFSHRVVADDVLCDQWAWLVDGVGVTLTCSVAREDYPAYCDLFEDVAATVALTPRAG